MGKIDDAYSILKQMIDEKSISKEEEDRIGLSEYRWVKARQGRKSPFKVRVGEVYQFDFGKNVIPEMSYEHRGLVIGKSKKLAYVLPIYSYNPQKHTSVIRPGDKPKKQNLYLLESSKHEFIKRDSVLKLDDIRTVSFDRIMYKHPGEIDANSSEFEKITFLVFQKYFPTFSHELQILRETTTV